jgi:hypothetical protein
MDWLLASAVAVLGTFALFVLLLQIGTLLLLYGSKRAARVAELQRAGWDRIVVPAPKGGRRLSRQDERQRLSDVV